MSNVNEDIKAKAPQQEPCDAEDMKEEETQAEAGEGAAEQTAEEQEAQAEETSKPAEEVKEEPKEDESVRYMRLMADFQNYKKRVEKEKTDLYQYANEKIAGDLLGVVDNFERALAQETADAAFKEGMELIFKQLCDVFEKSGIAEINALGEDFDPNFHNAVMTEDTDEYESGKVSGVLQKGYTLNGKVIRPAMVKVVG
ncbi:MAG: nucleotide exchange factor GrpE [Eubacterium sp.]|nr:nucleotide exchange factor GrpE [Candidatus Colimonas fimequi]